MEISKNGLRSNNPLDCLKLVYAICPDKLSQLFENIGIQLKDEKDLEIMAKIVENKIDTTGQLRDANDETRPLVFDCMRIINSIEFTPEEKTKAQTLTYVQ